MKHTPKGLVQFFTYEQPYNAPAVLAAPQLVQSEASLLGSLASADRPPTPPELRVPNWGASVGQTLANLPGNIAGAYRQAQQLPLEAQKIQTEMQEQNLAQERLKGIQNDVNQNPQDNSLQYQTNIQGTNVGVPSYPVPFGGVKQQDLNPGGQGFAAPPPTPPPDNPQNNTQSNTAPVGPITPANQQEPAHQTQQVPTITDAANAATATSLPAGADIYKAYKQHITDKATGWNAEFDAQGQPTNRIMIHHTDGVPMQPVDKTWAATYLPGLAAATNNPAMGKPVPSAPSAPEGPAESPKNAVATAGLAAAAPLASSPAGEIDQTDDQQNQDLATRLAQGQLSTQDVLSAGGAPWAGTKAAPQAPPRTPGQPSPYTPPVPRAQMVNPNPGQQAQSSGQQLGPGGFPVERPSNNTDPNYPGVRPVSSQAVAQAFGGVPPDLIGKALAANQYNVVGPAETSPDGTDAQGNPLRPSTQIVARVAGKAVPGYLDGQGNFYQVRNQTPYHETRVYANGKESEIDNAIGQHEDQEMMDASMKAGTVSGNWQSLSRPAKIAAYKQAQALEDWPVNQAQTDSLAAKENVIDASNNLLGLIDKYKTAGDPAAESIRNLYSAGKSNLMSHLGPAVKAATGGAVDLGDGDPRVDEMHQAYQKLDMAMRAQTGAAIAGRLPADAQGTQGVESLIGSFDSPRLPQLVQNNLKYLGQNMQVQLDHMIANRQRIPATAQYKANMITDGDNAPGGNQFPFPVKSRADYDRVPVGAKYQSEGYPAVTKLPGY
jgi:hypothetical protein